MTTSSTPATDMDATADALTAASTQAGLTAEQYKRKMERRKAVQKERLAARKVKKGLVIVHTGNGKGKTTAALGMVLRSLGHGYQVAIIQFIKGAWEPAEKAVFEKWPEQLDFHALGEGFTWETQDRDRDIAKARGYSPDLVNVSSLRWPGKVVHQSARPSARGPKTSSLNHRSNKRLIVDIGRTPHTHAAFPFRLG